MAKRERLKGSCCSAVVKHFFPGLELDFNTRAPNNYGGISNVYYLSKKHEPEPWFSLTIESREIHSIQW